MFNDELVDKKPLFKKDEFVPALKCQKGGRNQKRVNTQMALTAEATFGVQITD